MGNAANTSINFSRDRCIICIDLKSDWIFRALDYTSLVSVQLRTCAFSLCADLIFGVVLNVEGITELVVDLAVEIVYDI